MQYEGKTVCKKDGVVKEISFNDLFDTPSRQEWVRKYCEEILKKEPTSYFSGKDPLRTFLELREIHTFIIDDQFLRIIFQPYSIRGCFDTPFIVSLSYEALKEQWNPTNPLVDLLPQVISSQEFSSSWNESM